jgi:hypothetical protein
MRVGTCAPHHRGQPTTLAICVFRRQQGLITFTVKLEGLEEVRRKQNSKFLLEKQLTLKAMLHGAIFLATCNAILLLRDVN